MDFAPTFKTAQFGVFRLDISSGKLTKRGYDVKVQEQPLKLLIMLLQRPGEIVSREEICKQLWAADTFVDFDLGLNTATRKLRQALDDNAETPRYIETVPRRGYRFIAPVQLSPAPESKLPASEPAAVPVPASAESGPAAVPLATAPRRGKVLWAGAISAALLLGGLAYWIWRGRPADVMDSLAILPLANASGNPKLDYLGDGITEVLIDRFSALPELRIVPRNTVFWYKGKDTEPLAVGRALKVRALLTGRVIERGNDLSVSVELVDVTRDSQVWGATYNAHTSDLLNLEDAVMRQVLTRLRLPISRPEEAKLLRLDTDNADSYELYLKGRYEWNQRTETALMKGIDYFQQAIAKDPGFARAYAGLADSYFILGNFTFISPGEAYPKARAAALEALRLDDRLAEAHTALAGVLEAYDWDWDGAGREFRRALALNPNYATGRAWYAQYLMLTGHPGEAVEEIRAAQRLDPLALVDNVIAGRLFYYAGRYDQAIQEFTKTLDLEPGYAAARLGLGQVYEAQGRNREAVVEFERARASDQDSALILAGLAHALAVSGDREGAQELLAELREMSKLRYISPANLALVYVGLNQPEEALAALEEAYRERSNWIPYLRIDPRFYALRSNPQFIQIVRQQRRAEF
jgi:TolB-like protein/DNA-binding winged helix-turn-helix (wHTH) protein/tetratricopeptide (TPR) repeat protein